MNKLATMMAMAVGLVLVSAVPALAQEPSNNGFSIFFGGAIGTGLVVMGAAFGIAKLASSALESMARQPEVAGSIQTAMIIAAALIEGFTFYAIFVCSTKV